MPRWSRIAIARAVGSILVAGGPFEGADLERELVRLGPFPAVFVRIRLIRPEA